MVRRRPIAALTAVAVVLVAAFLRGRGYAANPPLNADEYDWAWTGLSLLQQHVPTGWTGLWDAYGHWQVFEWEGNQYAMVTPYLDHPPLFSLLVGGAAWVAGERVMTDVSLSVIRLVPIGLSLLVLILAYQLAQATVGTWPARVAILLLAFSPAAITLSRLTESEALLAVWFITALLAVNWLREHPTNRYAIGVLLVSCAAAPLTKVPGVAVGFAAAVVLFSWKRPRLAGMAATGALMGIFLFAVYGALLDLGIFTQVLSAHSDRHSGFSAGYEMLRGGLADWYWGLGVVGLGVLTTRGGSAARLIAWPVLAYVIVITLMANADLAGRYDWYRIPIYPLVYVGAGFLIAELARGIRRLATTQKVIQSGSASRSLLILVSLEACNASGMFDTVSTYALAS
jgi:4-amino-4-deoxy-L-arabinose transferase-like glycosyltransferase